MTKCYWCGMESDDELKCSWCKHTRPIEFKPVPDSGDPNGAPVVEPKVDWASHEKSGPKWGRILGSVALVAVVAAVAFSIGANSKQPVVQVTSPKVAFRAHAPKLDKPILENPAPDSSRDLGAPIVESSVDRAGLTLEEAGDEAPEILTPSPWLNQAFSNPTNVSPSSPPIASTEFDVAADNQTQFERDATARKIAAIKEDAKAYNEALAEFESFPSQYQHVADSEIGRSRGSDTSESRYTTGGTRAMAQKLRETSDALSLLLDKVMGNKLGRDLFMKGPQAIAKFPHIMRIHTNAFDEAAKVVESFPYLVPR